MLITNYITSAWRNILRHKLFSIINILGLAIGLAAVMLIALYVRYETSYDTFWKNADNIYRLETTVSPPNVNPLNTISTTDSLYEPLRKDFQQIKNITRLMRTYPVIRRENEVFQEMSFLVDPMINNIFDLETVSGNLNEVLSDNSSLGMSESMAAKYFADTDPIGQTVSVNYREFSRDYIIRAIIKDIPEQSMVELTFFALLDENDWKDTPRFTNWTYPSSHYYFTMDSGENVNDLNEQMPAFIDRNVLAFKGRTGKNTSDFIEYKAMNIKDAYLNSKANYTMRPYGNMTNIIVFSIVSFFILIIAFINYMNLSTARATGRAKEVSLRKTVGASRYNLIIQFLGESVFMTLLSLMIAFCLVELILPFYADFVGKNISLNYLSVDAILIVILAIIIGLIGGLYPAFVLSSFRPTQVLKANNSSKSNHSTKLRSALVLIQFSMSIILFVSTAVVYGQMKYTENLDLGFNQKNLIVLRTGNSEIAKAKRSLLLEEFQRLPNVINAASSNFMPAPVSMEIRPYRKSTSPDAEEILINASYIGYNYLDTYGIEMAAGRNFDLNRNDRRPSFDEVIEGNTNPASMVINQAAIGHFGFNSAENALGKTIYQRFRMTIFREYRIIGVIPDVHFQNLKTEVRPEVFLLDENSFYVISVRYAGEPLIVQQNIKEIWQREVPELPFVYEYASERMFNEYNEEKSQMTMFAAFSGLAIFIACLGLFGLASFTAERRTKEIGIRKVFGAEVWQIVKLLVWQFSKPVLIANIIAWPIAYIAMSRWLESFVYRIDDMVIIALCLVAGLTALLIAWATVAGNSYAVARQNPINALRYE